MKDFIQKTVLVIAVLFALNPLYKKHFTEGSLLQGFRTAVSRIEEFVKGKEEVEAATYEGIPAGYAFTRYLSSGMTGIDVKYLNIILIKEGVCSKCDPTSEVFASTTRGGVIAFQNKYADEILAPYGLASGTGYVGKTTVLKLNKLLALDTGASCVPLAPSSKPMLVGPKNGSTNNSLLPTFSWNSLHNWGAGCPDDKKYHIQVDDNRDFSSPIIDSTFAAKNSEFSSGTELSPSKTYYWWVRLENGSKIGEYSSVNYFSTASISEEVVKLDISVSPNSGTAPLNVTVTETVSGTHAGPFYFKIDCNNDGVWDYTFLGTTSRTKAVSNACSYSQSGTYAIKGRVDVSGGFSEAVKQVTVSGNQLPQISAGPDLTVSEGKTVTLEGSAFDPDNDPLTYSWSCGCGSLSNSTILTPIFIAPTVSANTNCICNLSVIDSRGGLATDSANVLVTDYVPLSLSAFLTPSASSGFAPLAVSFSSGVSGTALGTTNYTFYCNRGDSGTDITYGWAYKKDNVGEVSVNTSEICSYPEAGTYTAKVIVERNGLSAEARMPITVYPQQTTTYNPRVLLVNLNPVESGKGLMEKFYSYLLVGSTAEKSALQTANNNISVVKRFSDGRINYNIAKTINISSFPSYTNGFVYNFSKYQSMVINASDRSAAERQKWYFDYVKWATDNNICSIASANNIDEIWLAIPEYLSAYESFMIGPTDGFYVNGSGYVVSGCQKHYIVMTSGYNGKPFLHIYGHRIETSVDSYMTFNWTDPDKQKYWENFANIQRGANPEMPFYGSGCGNAHFPLNASKQYDVFNKTYRDFNCPDWNNFPNFTGQTKRMNCDSWGCVDSESSGGWAEVWLGSIPHNDKEASLVSKAGTPFTVKGDWWYYLLYPENMIAFVKQTAASNHPPVANAGSDKSIFEKTTVSLDGLGSDPDNDSLSFYWSCDGGSVSNPSQARAVFSAPEVSVNTVYVCTLTVTDSKGLSAKDSMTVTVKNQAAATLYSDLSASPSSGLVPLNNVSLTANALGTASGTVIYTFYCNRSDSGTNVTTGWASRIEGTSSSTYTASNICHYLYSGTYTPKVIIERGGLVSEKRVTIVVSQPVPVGNQAPVVEAGQDIVAYGGQTITLNASAFDPDGDAMTYAWSCWAGTISSTKILNPTIVVRKVSVTSNEQCTLTITDSKGLSSSDSLFISIKPGTLPFISSLFNILFLGR